MSGRAKKLSSVVLTALVSGVFITLCFSSTANACHKFNPFCNGGINNLDPTTGDIYVSNNTNRRINVLVYRPPSTRNDNGFRHHYILAPRERNVLVENNVATGTYILSAVEVNSRNQAVSNGKFWNGNSIHLNSSGFHYSFNP